MKVAIEGHEFALDNLKSAGASDLRFFMDPDLHGGRGHQGPSTQEVLRACISRVQSLHAEKPAPENDEIIKCLRRAILFFELRALRVKAESVDIETLETWPNGHIWSFAA